MILQCVIYYQHLNTPSKIIPLNQHKFQILNQNGEARRKLGEENAYEQESKSIPSSFDQVNMVPILNVTKSLRWV